MRTTLFVVAILWFCLLVGCTLVTEALRATGVISPSGGMMEAAKAVDTAIGSWLGGWVRDALLIGSGAAATETGRLAVRARKARKARLAASDGKR